MKCKHESNCRHVNRKCVECMEAGNYAMYEETDDIDLDEFDFFE